MAITPKVLDPVQGLIDYTLSIKPYHTKIIEVLEEYIHTDIINVTMTDKLDLCVNFGIPNLNTLFDFPIIQVDLGNNSVVLNGDVRNLINVGQRILIDFSVNNNGNYHILSVTYNSTENISTLVFQNNNLISADVDGRVVNSVIQYCPFIADKGTNVLEIPEIFCEDGYGNIYDSFMGIVLSINTTTREIILDGDRTIELENTTTVSLINELLFVPNTDNDIVGTFHIDSFIYDGSQTIITVIEDIATFPTFNINDSYQLLIKYMGYDEAIKCDFTSDPNASETLFVSMTEDFQLDIGLDFNESFTAYNLENSFQSGFDNIGFGVIVSQTQPLLPETIIPPAGPVVNDLWFDSGLQVLKQWHNFGWVTIPFAYWYQEDPSNNQIVSYYKLIKNSIEDTDWILFDGTLNDNVLDGYDIGPFDVVKNNYFHPEGQVVVDVPLNGLFLIGGDFTPLLLHNLTIKTYGTAGLINGIQHTNYVIDSYGTNTITLNTSAGDLTNLFVSGVGFKIEDSTLENKTFNVISSSFTGINTVVSVVEDLTHNSFNDTLIGVIPGIFYIQPNTFGSIDSVSTLYIVDTVVNTSVSMIEYQYNGPIQFIVDMFPTIDMNVDVTESGFSNELFVTVNNSTTGDGLLTSITDEVSWSWGNIIDWFQYYIIGFPNINEIVVAGDATTDIQVNQQFRIIGSTLNAGLYSVLSTVFDGVSTLITINEVIDPLELGGYIEPVDILPIRIILEDIISTSIQENPLGGLLDDSGNIIESYDYTYFDVGGYDSMNPNDI